MTFEELNLAPAIVQAVHEQGYTTPAWELFPYGRSALFAEKTQGAHA